MSAQLSINPQPSVHASQCLQCLKNTLGDLLCGKGNGKVVENYGQWFQVVSSFILRIFFF